MVTYNVIHDDALGWLSILVAQLSSIRSRLQKLQLFLRYYLVYFRRIRLIRFAGDTLCPFIKIERGRLRFCVLICIPGTASSPALPLRMRIILPVSPSSDDNNSGSWRDDAPMWRIVVTLLCKYSGELFQCFQTDSELLLKVRLQHSWQRVPPQKLLLPDFHIPSPTSPIHHSGELWHSYRYGLGESYSCNM